jgi:hypothetical protein
MNHMVKNISESLHFGHSFIQSNGCRLHIAASPIIHAGAQQELETVIWFRRQLLIASYT